MARDGYLIIDSDLHFNEPGDLWERYLDEPYRANPPRFFGGMQQTLKEESKEDKGNADNIRGMEVQGLAIPSFAKQTGRDRVQPRAAAPQPLASSAFRGRALARFRRRFDPDRDGCRRHRRGGHVRDPGTTDPVSRQSGARATPQRSRARTTTGRTTTARRIRSA